MPKPLTQDAYIEEVTHIHHNKYDYSQTIYKSIRDDITFICKKCKGTTTINAKKHKNGQGCFYCNGNVPLNTETFIERSKMKFGDKYDYSDTVYIDSKTELEIKCYIHGIFKMLPTTHYGDKHNGNCKHCDAKEKKQKKFIETSKEIYGEDIFDYSLVNYCNSTTPIILICKNGHRFTVKPKDHLTKKEFCKECI